MKFSKSLLNSTKTNIKNSRDGAPILSIKPNKEQSQQDPKSKTA